MASLQPISIGINDFYAVVRYNEDGSSTDTGSGDTFDRGPGGDRDRIDLQIYNNGDINPEEIKVIFSSQVDWWKEIKAITRDGNWMATVQTQDQQKGPNSMVVKLGDLGALIFSKAKFLGAHTAMYSLGRDQLQEFGGFTLDFFWRFD